MELEDESMQQDSLLDPDSSMKVMNSFQMESDQDLAGEEEEEEEDLDRHDRMVLTTSLPITVSNL